MGGPDSVSLSSRSSRSSRSSHSSDDSGDRLQWGSQLEFILTLVGYAVGLGNVWRFPYLCYKNGGGAFLIPYFLMLLLVGLPIFYLEISFGQFASLGPIKAWRINPLMKGLGITMVTTNVMIAGYYCVIISWTIYFFFASMAAEVPWATCDNSWNTEFCFSPEQARNITEYNLTRTIGNITYDNTHIKTSPEEYFYINVLNMSDGIEDFGKPVWQLTCCLLLAWTIVFFVLLKGIGSLGKVVYFSSLFPYLIMTVMVIRGCTLEGASEGIDYYLKPDWARLAEPVVWSDAATQIFYSLSTCTGGIIAMASFNKFDNNSLRDSIIVPIINCLTSFYSGFAIFSVLGFMAKQKGVTVDEVAASGPGLVFVVYPEGLMQLPVSPVWSVLFFLMMMTLGFSSVFSMAECFFAAVIDEFPERLQKNRQFIIFFRLMGTICFFLFGFTMTFEGGFYLFNIVDSFTGGFPLLFVGLFEFIAISYIYGFKNFSDDVKLMSGKHIHWIFRVLWVAVSPALLLAVILFLAIEYVPLTIEDYVYPDWGYGIGWAIVSICLFGIPLVFVIQFCKHGAAKAVKDASTPTDLWGPALARDRRGTKYDRSRPSERQFEGVSYTESSGQMGTHGQYNPQDKSIPIDSFSQSFQGNTGYNNLAYVSDKNLKQKSEPPPGYQVESTTLL